MSRRTDRHAARRAQRAASAPRRILLAVVGTAATIVLGITAGGATYAAWSVAAPASSATTLRAGSAGLTVANPQLAATGLYPGRTVRAATTVRNTGTTPLSLSITPTATATAFTSALVVTAGTAASAADCAAGRVTAPVTATIGTTRALGGTLAPGASALVCIGLGLPDSAPAAAAGAAASPLTLTVSGTQVQP